MSSRAGGGELGGFSIWELFRFEVEDKVALLTEALLALEQGNAEPSTLESLMRAAHSLKGAAAMVDAQVAVEVAHVMEDVFVAMQRGTTVPTARLVDVLLEGVDLLRRIGGAADAVAAESCRGEAQQFHARLTAPERGSDSTVSEPDVQQPVNAEAAANPGARDSVGPAETPEREGGLPWDEQAVRVDADRLNRLLGLAGESLVTSRWLDEFLRTAQRTRQMQLEVVAALDRLRDEAVRERVDATMLDRISDVQRRFGDLRQSTTRDAAELEEIQRSAASLIGVLYREAVDLRMRPFAEGVSHLPRLVRTLSRQLDRDVTLELRGENTPVDRDIMELLDAPLVNLLRNAVDHGIEPPAERVLAGKPARGTIRLEASHRAGMLFVTLEDDGRGVDPEAVRRAVVARKLASHEQAERLSPAEVLEFLFLPGFSLRDTVTEISGRGVGLDIVQTATRQAGGTVSVTSHPNNGLRFSFQLPLTLSVIRALLVQIGGEPYALPIARVSRVLKVPSAEIYSVEGRQHINVDGATVGLVAAHQLFDLETQAPQDEVPVLLLGQGTARYGLRVERLLGERELVVRPLDPMLGKVKDVSSAALLPDRTPVLILDIEDVIQSIESLIATGRVTTAAPASASTSQRARRILVVEDSFTVRELERKVLTAHGYEVDVAVDGMDGWNAIRSGNYDLVVTDVDMPRMDGIELVTRMRQDARFTLLPIIIVSYKEREEDRLRGLNAGADRYLAKGSYHDESLIHAITELIGSPEAV